MDDLISRKAAVEYLMTNMGWHDEDGYEVDDADEKRTIIEDLINGIPSIPAVPLDKLCEWLANSFSDPPCCTLENVRCKMECRGFTQMDYSECWRHVLIKWMEGLDGTD